MGKIAICNKCSERFQLDRRALRQAYPTCLSCVESPRQREIDKAARFFAGLEGKVAEEG
jgi:hypothetical protein